MKTATVTMSNIAGRLDAQYYLGEDSVILVRKISDGYYQVLSSGWGNQRTSLLPASQKQETPDL